MGELADQIQYICSVCDKYVPKEKIRNYIFFKKRKISICEFCEPDDLASLSLANTIYNFKKL